MKKTIVLLLTLLIPLTAFGYIDPGSGSFMLQMLFAAFVGAGFTLRTQFKILKEKIKRLFKKAEPTHPSKGTHDASYKE